MKKLILFLALFVSFSIAADAQKSPRKQAEGEVLGTKIEIDYGAPSVRGRTIWGGLEAYNVVWRAGANENTTVAFDKEVTIGGKKLAAGKYGFFIIPKKEGDWTVIFSTKNAEWGAYSYKEKNDALRLDVSPNWSKESQEQLSYSVEGNDIVFAWEKVTLKLPISAN